MSLAENLTNQAWKQIGEGPDKQVEATSCQEQMIIRNFVVLERLLLKVVFNRKDIKQKTCPRCSRTFLLSTRKKANKHFRLSQYFHTSKHDINLRKRMLQCTCGNKHEQSSNLNNTWSVVTGQLFLFVTRVAELYRDVHYHNFQHASHVTLSANKLIDILLSCEYSKTEKANYNCTQGVPNKSTSDPADKFERSFPTFDISNDPLMHFALVFSALIHDVEHRGLPNAQLVKELDKLSAIYLKKSIAEQYSIAVAFSVLSEPCFKELREAICVDEEESERFRGLVVDLILSTDISCPERTAKGKSKWKIAFSDSECITRRHSVPIKKRSKSRIFCGANESKNRLTSAEIAAARKKLKSRVIMEQLMQVADVAHLMQDWEVFLKWNKKLYDELWAAKTAGRGFDPSANWYHGQISFFDNYVIPLSKRIHESGVFGCEGAVFMNNAIRNKERWIEEGMQQAKHMVENIDYVKPNIRANSEQVVIFDPSKTFSFSSLPKTPNRSTRAA